MSTIVTLNCLTLRRGIYFNSTAFQVPPKGKFCTDPDPR